MHQAKSKNNVLFFSYGEFYPFLGGTARYAKSLAESLASQNNITVIAHPDKTKNNTLSNVTIHRPRLFTRFSVGQLLASLYFMYMAFMTKPSIIFITDIQSLYFARYLLQIKRILFPHTKVAVTFYGTEIKDISGDYSPLNTHLFKTLSLSIDSFICISLYTKELLIKHFPFIDQQLISIIYPTIDKEFLNVKISKQDSVVFLKKNKLDKNNYIISTGRLVKRKGHAHILQTLHPLVKKNPALRYVIIGSGPEKERLISLSKELKVHNNFLILDATEKEKKILLENCLFYVHPSIETEERGQKVEGFGIAILEALLAGKIALVHNHGGMKEIISHGQNGIITNVLDTKLLLSELDLLIKDKQLLAQLTSSAKTSSARFSHSSLHQQVTSCIKMMNMKRIAYIIEWFYPIIGGAGKQALLLAKHMPGYEINFYTKRPAKTDELDTIQGFQVKRFGKETTKETETQKRSFDYSSSLALFLKLYKERNNIDMIHVHGNLTNNFATAAILTAHITKKPLLAKPALYGEFKAHGHLQTTNYLSQLVKTLNPLNILRRHIATTVPHYAAISKDIVRELIEVGVSVHNIHAIPNGIDVSNFKPHNYSATYHRKTIHFLAVSRLAENKGVITPLLEMWNKYYKNNSAYKLTIVGAGEGLMGSVEKEVKDYVAKHKLNNVTLAGQQKEVKSFYENADVFIIPSLNEGLSNSLLEASSHGLIVIASNISGNTDLVEDEKTGYLFVSKSIEDLHHTIEKALNNKKEWKTISTNMLKNIQKNYSIESVSKKYQEIYQRLLP